MAGLPSIDTGYKPEFALGALYQGFNAGNADQSAQQEIIKQYLANQREESMQPIDVAQGNQNLLAGMYKTDPRYQEGMTSMIEGQGLSNLTAGQNAQALQQFKQAAERARMTKETSSDNLFSQLFGKVQRQHDQSLPEKEREAAAQGAFILNDTLAQIDPEFRRKQLLLDQKGEQAMDLKELDLAGRAKLASMKQAAVKGDKTAQEALVKHLQSLLSSGQITPEVYASELAELQNAILAAKIQPGPELDTSNPQLSRVFKPKAPQTTYTAPVTGQTPAATPTPQQAPRKLSDEERAALIKSLTQGK